MRAPITDQELAAPGGLKRNIVMRAVFAPATADQPPNAVIHPGSEVDDWFFQTGFTNFANTVFAFGTATEQASTTPGLPTEFIPFQSTRALKQTVALGSVEEWTIYNMNTVRHPFHIHVNPFQVVKINGQPVDPYWADTIALPPMGTPSNPTSVTFRTRFADFHGAFVMHCHMLAHEDLGLMQMVEVV
jgi:FtsP/CotA-like multicopper oxidase with cupredoxin domain